MFLLQLANVYLSSLPPDHALISWKVLRSVDYDKSAYDDEPTTPRVYRRPQTNENSPSLNHLLNFT